jgi:Leucine-rich repeat (LRR) protein
MKTETTLIMLLSLGALFGCFAQDTQPTATPASAGNINALLRDLETRLQQALQTQVDPPHRAKVNDLTTKYASAVGRALASATKAGNLDDAVALKAEQAAVQDGKSPGPADDPVLRPVLKPLRTIYHTALAALDQERVHLTRPIYERYITALALYEKQLTQSNRIDDALAVRVKKEAAQSVIGPSPEAKLGARTSASARPSTTESANLSAADTVSFQQCQREVCQKILDLDGIIRVLYKNQEFELRKGGALPSGSFDLRTLYIIDKPITDGDMAKLAGCKQLVSVSCDGCAVSKLPLDRIPGLETLSVVRTKVTDAELAGLAECPKLREISVNDTGVDGSFLAKLGGLKNIARFGFDGSQLNDEGAASLSLFPVLHFLSVRNTRITAATIPHIAKCSRMTELYLSGLALADGSLAPFAELKSLKILILDDARLSPTAFPEIARCTSLETLGLLHTSITDDDARHIALLPNLTVLGLADTAVSGAAFSSLAKTGRPLKTLYLDRGCPVTEVGVEALVNAFPNLSTLEIQANTLTPAAAASLARLRSLSVLRLRGRGVNDTWAEKIAAMNNLVELDLSGTGVTDAAISMMAGMKNLQIIVLRDTAITDAIEPSIQKWRSLRSIYVGGAKLTPDGRARLAALRRDLGVGD